MYAVMSEAAFYNIWDIPGKKKMLKKEGLIPAAPPSPEHF